MVTFEKAGPQNMEETLRIGLKRAIELDCPIVASSTRGGAAEKLLELAAELGFKNKVVIVRGASSKVLKGGNQMTPETKASLEARGVTVVTAAHALSAGERGISTRYKGMYPLELMADTLRMFSQGTKVAVEISVMALEADAIPYGVPVVSCGGTHRGVDSAIVVTPAYNMNLLETVIHELLCKPFDPSNAHINMRD